MGDTTAAKRGAAKKLPQQIKSEKRKSKKDYYGSTEVWSSLQKLQDNDNFSPVDCLLSKCGIKQTSFKKSRKEKDLTWPDGVGPDVIYCSPMRRCLITAIRGFKNYPDTPIKIHPCLREMHKPSASKKNILAWLVEENKKDNFGAFEGVPVGVDRIEFVGGETLCDRSRYGEDSEKETIGETASRRETFMKYLRKEMKKKNHRAVISFHGKMMNDFVKSVNTDGDRVLLDAKGKYPTKFSPNRRKFPFNFKPYFASINFTEGCMPVLFPYKADDGFHQVMLIRHAESLENCVVWAANHAVRKKENVQKALAKVLENETKKKGGDKKVPKKKRRVRKVKGQQEADGQKKRGGLKKKGKKKRRASGSKK